MQYILQRDGKAPLIFEGNILSESIGDRSIHYAHDLRLYQLESGKFVLEIIHSNNYPSRIKYPNHYFAFVCKTPDDVKRQLTIFRGQIDGILIGPQPGAWNSVVRRQALMKKVLGEYDTQVSRLLDHLVFAEEVE